MPRTNSDYLVILRLLSECRRDEWDHTGECNTCPHRFTPSQMRIHQLGSDSPETPMFTEMLGHLASASRTVIFPQPWQVTRMRIALLLGFGKGPGVPVLIDSHPAIIAGKWQGARPGTGRVPTEAPKRQDRERVSGTPASLQRSSVVYPGQSSNSFVSCQISISVRFPSALMTRLAIRLWAQSRLPRPSGGVETLSRRPNGVSAMHGFSSHSSS